MTLRMRALAILALAVLLAACGGEDKPLSGITAIDDLRGGTIGISSVEDTATLELRFVLLESYGLVTGTDSTGVTLVELPVLELLSQLRQGEVDAVLIPPGSTLAQFDEADFRILSRVTKEMSDVTGLPVVGSLLLTYADTAEAKASELFELNRMLMEGMTYLEVNRDDVIAIVASEQEDDEEAIRGWWDALNLLFGNTSLELQEQITGIWSAALALGDIVEVPLIGELMLFGADGEALGIDVRDEDEEPDLGDRATISLGVLDDASRRAALYAIEQGIVDSETIDVSITYLARSELTDAVSARQFDVIEASPLAVPLGVERELEFVIVSGGVQNVDGALLVVLNR
ncbi:MAG: hypothetical protein J4N95_07160 [Chloroflexi bacterium]|nr:hypothetical protein [Chloroflexota bacterium]MCI0856891.1 hypothetical protein [Chloroflexota bacterium]